MITYSFLINLKIKYFLFSFFVIFSLIIYHPCGLFLFNIKILETNSMQILPLSFYICFSLSLCVCLSLSISLSFILCLSLIFLSLFLYLSLSLSLSQSLSITLLIRHQLNITITIITIINLSLVVKINFRSISRFFTSTK